MKTVESDNCPKRKNQKKRKKEKRKTHFLVMHFAFKERQLPAFRTSWCQKMSTKHVFHDTPNLIS